MINYKFQCIFLSKPARTTILIIVVIHTISYLSINTPTISPRSYENDSTTRKWGYIHVRTLNKQLTSSHLKSLIPNFHTISIIGYKLDKTGKLHLPDTNILQCLFSIAKENRVAILPLISFASTNEGRILLKSSKAQNRAISELINISYKKYTNGIHMDFEYLPPKDVYSLSDFLKKLHTRLHDKRLTMAIFPQVNFPNKWADFHNLNIIGEYLDEIVIMCSDYHRPGTSPGPIIDIKWAERNIIHALRFLQPNQIWLGVPIYGYIWSDQSITRVISSRKGVLESQKHRGIRHLSGSVFYQYTKDEKLYQVYFADAGTRKLTERLAIKYNLQGLAFWRLGFEEDDYWR